MKLAQMVRLDRSRVDCFEEFQRMIGEYNAGSSHVEAFFLLTKPEPRLTKHEKLVLDWRKRQTARAMVWFKICGEWKTGEHAGCPRVS